MHSNFYIDGNWLGSLTANSSRADIGASYLGEGSNHGFDGTLSYSAPGNHKVCGWIIGDNTGAPNYGMGCRTLVIDNDAIGSFDLIQQTSGGIRVAGWGIAPSVNGPAPIHVYINGAFAAALSANLSRPDVNEIYPAQGSDHGFDGNVPWATSGAESVCAWVVNTGSSGAPNYGLGCKNLVFQ